MPRLKTARKADFGRQKTSHHDRQQAAPNERGRFRPSIKTSQHDKLASWWPISAVKQTSNHDSRVLKKAKKAKFGRRKTSNHHSSEVEQGLTFGVVQLAAFCVVGRVLERGNV